jgi:hypothetical protein
VLAEPLLVSRMKGTEWEVASSCNNGLVDQDHFEAPYSHLQIQKFRVRFSELPNFLRSSRLERGPLSLVSTTEELLGRNSSCFGLENHKYGRGDPPS